MIRLILLLSFLGLSSVYAAPTVEARNLSEKTFTRDNAFCHFKNKTIEIQIRGDGRSIERKEAGYGQYIFHIDQEDYSLLPINSERLGRYKFFQGKKSLCSKPMAVKLDLNTVAVLFQKENDPFKDKLIIQLYDFNSATAKEVIESQYLTSEVELLANGFIFKSVAEKIDREVGKVTIAGHEYIYQDQDMNPWLSYTLKGFEIMPSLTYHKSQWKSFFKDESDFFMFTGWNNTSKQFNNPYVYTAINHQLKKECLLFYPTPQRKLDGTEFWRCKDK